MYNSTTVKQLIDWMRAEVLTRGHVTYTPHEATRNRESTYFTGHCSDETVGCFVGQGLTAINAETPEEGVGIATLCDLDVDQGNLNWLTRVQYCQDIGQTWTQAIEYADRMQFEYLARVLTGGKDIGKLTEA